MNNVRHNLYAIIAAAVFILILAYSSLFVNREIKLSDLLLTISAIEGATIGIAANALAKINKRGGN